MATTKKTTTTKKKAASMIQFSSDNNFDRVLSCGRAKTGKTFFACSYPKPFVINCDKGLATVRDKKIPYVTVERMDDENKNDRDRLTRYKDLLQIVRDLKYQEGKYWDMLEEAKYVPETIVLDSLSAMSDLMEAEVMISPPDGKDRKEQLQIQDYGLIQRRIFGLVDILRESPYHVVCTIGIDLRQSDTGSFLDQPLATGSKLGPQLPHFFDEVYLHEYDRDKEQWTLTPVQSKRFPFAGSRKGLDMKMFYNPTFDKLKKEKK
jgi:hypothetical protein